MRFKTPKYGHFCHYCYDCEHYKFERQVGCAYIGKCNAIKGEEIETDAYHPPCGLWTAKRSKQREMLDEIEALPTIIEAEGEDDG